MRRDPLENLKVVAIVGPTASGKSALAVELAKEFNGVIISADSRQIYRGMDIGTTKISKEETQNVPHYMLDIVEPHEEFSVSAYQKSVLNLLRSIARKNQRLTSPIVPFIVGGTGLYVGSIVDGLTLPNVKPNPHLRAKLDKMTLESLQKKLKKLDPKTKVDIKNKRRIIRAIEILEEGGESPGKKNPAYRVLKLGIRHNRQQTLKRIQERIYNLDMEALIKETKKLIRKKYKFSLPALSALGYRDVKNFIAKKIDKEELQARLLKLHSQYAKRQMTWFKKDPEILWIKDTNEAEKLVSQFLFD